MATRQVYRRHGLQVIHVWFSCGFLACIWIHHAYNKLSQTLLFLCCICHYFTTSAFLCRFHFACLVSDDPNQTLQVGATKCSGLWAVKESEWINKESTSSTTGAVQYSTVQLLARNLLCWWQPYCTVVSSVDWRLNISLWVASKNSSNKCHYYPPQTTRMRTSRLLTSCKPCCVCHAALLASFSAFVPFAYLVELPEFLIRNKRGKLKAIFGESS